ncbi:MAG TPA: hypothetical protein VGC30_01055 [Dokdonella sp.]
MARAYRNGFLCLLILLSLAHAPYAAVTMDFARDVFTAERLLHGEAFPLAGPILGGVLHLGPLWYYALASMLGASGGHWLGLSALIALVSALQIPFAYLGGKALADRRTGLLWAAALALPSLGTFAAMLPSHPTFAWPAVTAFLLCAIRAARRPQPKYLFGMALALMLALHAHPSTLALTWIGVPVALYGARRGALRGRDFAIAAAIVLLPYLPLFAWDAAHGFGDLRTTAGYTATFDLARTAAALPALLEAVTLGGPRYWIGPVLGGSPRAEAAVAAALVVCAALAGLGLLRLAAQPATRLRAALALLAFAAALAITALLRDITPFYMTAAVHVAGAGVLALGLGALADRRAVRALCVAFAAFALGADAWAAAGAARLQTRGAWPFAWFPLMDVAHARGAAAPLLLMPAYAMPASARFLCTEPAPAIHGGYANALLLNYAVETRLACPSADVELGGNDPARTHWLGLSRALFARLDVDPQRRLGPVGVVRAEPIAFGRALRPADEPRYPAYTPQFGAAQPQRLRIRLQAGQFLVVSDLATELDRGFAAVATLAGRPLAPKAADTASRVYACDACAAGEDAEIELTLTSANPGDLDVVTFRAGAR